MTSHELADLRSEHHSSSHPSIEESNSSPRHELEQVPLPPVDQGKGAWLILASCCLIQLPVWGAHLFYPKVATCLLIQDARVLSRCRYLPGIL